MSPKIDHYRTKNVGLAGQQGKKMKSLSNFKLSERPWDVVTDFGI